MALTGISDNSRLFASNPIKTDTTGAMASAKQGSTDTTGAVANALSGNACVAAAPANCGSSFDSNDGCTNSASCENS
ncbi:MAG: hypothetical protein PHC34_00265 [Candidatus Gastranaerophilales bacterium]|nr:hypothetical protein [Candidatus Gastranaerophilales bacterium]